MKTKKCSKCREIKGVNEFYTSKYTIDKLSYQCKDCQRKYYEDNKEEITVREKEYYKNNKEKRKKYEADNKEKILVRKRKYYEKNKEKIDIYQKEYREKNKKK